MDNFFKHMKYEDFYDVILVGPDQQIYKKDGHSSQSFKPPVYSVCKAGLIGLTKFMATYYAGTKIRVNMLTPSGVYNNQLICQLNFRLRLE